MLRLKRLYLRNWMTVAESTVDFPESGMVAVIGENRSLSGQLASIGAGKTALGEALVIMLFGLLDRYGQLSYYSRNEAGDTYLRLDATLDGKPLVVEFGYRCPELSKTGEGLRLVIDGAKLEHGHVKETRAALLKALRLGPDLASWTTYLDGLNLRFDKLSQAAAVELVMSALDQPPWSQHQAKVKKLADQANLELQVQSRLVESVRAQLQRTQGELVRYRELQVRAQQAYDQAQAGYQDALAGWTKMDAELAAETADLEAKVGASQAQLTEALEAALHAASPVEEKYQLALDQAANACQEAERQVAAAQASYTAALQAEFLSPEDEALVARIAKGKAILAQWDQAVQDRLADSRDLGKQASQARQAFNTYRDGGKCPHCGHQATSPDPAHLQQLDQQANELKAQHEASQTDYEEVRDGRDGVKARLSDLEVQRGNLRSRLLQDYKARLGAAQADHQAAKDGQRRAKQRLDEAKQARLDEAKRATAQQERALARAKDDLRTAKDQHRRHEFTKPAAPSDRQLLAANADLQAEQRAHDGHQAALQAGAAKLQDLSDQQKLCQYWYKAFAPAGIPNLVLRAAVGPLNQASLVASQAVVAGAMKVEFQTSTELASGDAKPKLNVVVANPAGSSRAQGGSKGEQGLANLLIAEGLTTVARTADRVAFRWLDEATNSQDQHVRRQLYAYLRRQAAERQSLTFVVDHHPDLEGYADHVLIASKSPDGLTTYRWR